MICPVLGTLYVTVHQGHQKVRLPSNCKRLPVLQMRGIGLRAIAALCEQAYDKADAVLVNVYLFMTEKASPRSVPGFLKGLRKSELTIVWRG